jgi:NAD(P)-dependent dehydrogenase (short-subunit alcohol dehydrogenase family)
MPSLKNKVVLITGGARGIGAATAQAVVAAGGKVVLTDVDSEPLDKLAAELGDAAALGIVADVTDLPSMEAAVTAGVAKFGGIDVVMANAGIASYGSVLAVDPAVFRRLIDINVNGVFHTVRAALPAVIERKGYVLVVSSLAAFAAAPGLAPYNASKAGVEHFANALRLEVHQHGVDVGVAHMSWIDTPLVQDAKNDLRAFRELVDSLPGPLSRTTTVEACVDAFVKGIEKRRRRIYVPGWVGLIRARRNLLSSAIGDRATLKDVPRLLTLMDEEVRQLGRSTSARNT